jgi:hypothetical protein
VAAYTLGSKTKGIKVQRQACILPAYIMFEVKSEIRITHIEFLVTLWFWHPQKLNIDKPVSNLKY